MADLEAGTGQLGPNCVAVLADCGGGDYDGSGVGDGADVGCVVVGGEVSGAPGKNKEDYLCACILTLVGLCNIFKCLS
jgi:hypothetical protein